MADQNKPNYSKCQIKILGRRHWTVSVPEKTPTLNYIYCHTLQTANVSKNV